MSDQTTGWKEESERLHQLAASYKRRAEQAEAELAQTRSDLHELDLIRRRVAERGATDSSTPLFVRIANIIERMELAELRIAALRIQPPPRK